MARPLRIEFPNAIYHVIARGNGRQAIFHAYSEYQRMTDGLAKSVDRTGWQATRVIHQHQILTQRETLPGMLPACGDLRSAPTTR